MPKRKYLKLQKSFLLPCSTRTTLFNLPSLLSNSVFM